MEKEEKGKNENNMKILYFSGKISLQQCSRGYNSRQSKSGSTECDKNKKWNLYVYWK